MNKIKINIGGIEYRITTNKDPDYVKRLSKEINNKIDSYLNQNKNLALNQVFMLVMLELADVNVEIKKSEDKLKKQINKYTKECDKKEKEIFLLKQELDKLKK